MSRSFNNIVGGSADGYVHIWDYNNKKYFGCIQAHKGCVRCIQCDSVKVISGGDDGKIKIFDILYSTCLREFNDHTNSILSLQFDSYIKKYIQ